MGGAWETISKPIIFNVREMLLQACLNMTSGMGGLAFKQTESETPHFKQLTSIYCRDGMIQYIQLDSDM